jgi:hypothetical protein
MESRYLTCNLLSGIAFGNGLYIAMVSGATTVVVLPDGVTWQTCALPENGTLTSNSG